ncbi:MAG TPA: ABC transporter permease subunit, partial [Vicinamibacteria bacterium]|nr:ABC transporter permease subunit [Vicinamibacteria bacterium]
YVLSLGFALVYGYLAATRPRLERFMIPALDVLQSIPVLSFLPGVVLAMVALFPHREIGVELGSIVLIFTGQVWNLAFGFYSSVKSLPRDLEEAAYVCRFGRWQRFSRLVLPHAAISLVWNSMMSVAGGWFFLMACEMFVLGSRDFRLPGLGSYLQTAASAGDMQHILWGLLVLVAVIVLLDLLIWRPLITWADRFKVEQVQALTPPHSPVLELLRRSSAVAWFKRRVTGPIDARLLVVFPAPLVPPASVPPPPRGRRVLNRVVGAAFLALVGYGIFRAGVLLTHLSRADLLEIAAGTGATFVRVLIALVLGLAWTVPVGVHIGLSPRLARLAQPLAQVAASIPATALFPIVVIALARLGGGMDLAAVLLMLLGTQWYILFNVIAGAMTVPEDMKETVRVFRMRRVDRWRYLFLPAIFPHLVTGLVTAGGGAWNASIVAEYFHFGGQTLSTLGLGSTISHATDAGNFGLLLGATVAMAATVVTFNRLVWRRLYRLAEERFTLEG